MPNINYLSRSRRFGVYDISSQITGTFVPPLPLSAGELKANAWSALVVTNGGSAPSANTLSASAAFWDGVVSCSIHTKIKALNFFAADNLTASFTPFVSDYGNTLWTNIGSSLSGANLTVNGIDGGRSKGLNTGVNPTTCFADSSSGGFTNYIYSIEAVGSGYAAFGYDPGFLGYDVNGTYYMNLWQTGGNQSWAIGAFRGFLSANRTGGNQVALWRANSSTGISAVITSSNAPIARPNSANIFAASYNDGSNNAWGVACYSKHSFVAIHDGLTAAEAANWYNLIQGLRLGLGGGYV